MSERWYDKTVAQIETQLNTDAENGLSLKVLRKRQRKGLTNVIFPIPHRSYKEYLTKILTEPANILLIFTSLITAILENEYSAWVIMGILFINCLLSVFTYSKAQQVLEDMGHLSIPTSKVMRNGRLYLVHSEQIVEGDLILLSAGDMVPCDGRVVEQENFNVLETNLTGIGKPVGKDPDFIRYTHDVPPAQQANMVFASSIVTKGMATVIACCVGNDTLVCKLKKNKSPATHEEIREISFLKKFSKNWSLIMIGIIFVLTFIDLFLKTESRGLFDVFLTGLCLAAATGGELHITSAYVIISGGLFGAVTKKGEINSGALIKNVSKIESLKKITCLLVNKEGAFSLRGARVEKVFANNYLYDKKEVHFAENSARTLRFALISTGLYGADKLLKKNLNKDNIYSPEEDAIIDISRRCNVYNMQLDTNYPLVEHTGRTDTSRFETSLVFVGSEFLVACRGELDSILSVCNSYCENGRSYYLDTDKKVEIVSEASRLSREAYKIIGVATKRTSNNSLQRIISCQTDMTFEGFIAIRENMLPGVAKCIASCKAQGIKVIMFCDDVGEHNVTLAESLGIIKNRDEAISGKELFYMKEEMFHTNTSLYKLYQGTNVTQKRQLLNYLRQDGEKVGVLARELDEIILMKESDVGFIQSTTLSHHVGKFGLDIAENTDTPVVIRNSKDSKKGKSEAMKFISDVIVSEGNIKGKGGFNAVYDAISASKAIYQNLLHMVKYLVASQVARVFIVLFSVLSKNVLISPEQILFCGLIFDFFAVIVFSFEKNNKSLSKNSKYEQVDDLWQILPYSLAVAFCWAISVVVVPLVLMLLKVQDGDIISSVMFVSILLSQMAVFSTYLFDDSIFKSVLTFNRAYILLFVSLVSFIALSATLPSIGIIMSIINVKWYLWLITLIPSLLMIFFTEILKIINNTGIVDRILRSKSNEN